MLWYYSIVYFGFSEMFWKQHLVIHTRYHSLDVFKTTEQKVYRPQRLWCSVSSAVACRDADKQEGTNCSTRLSRPHPHSQSIHTLSIQWHSSLVALILWVAYQNVSVRKVLLGLSLPLWKFLWYLLSRRKADWIPSSRSPFWPRLGLYRLPSSLLSDSYL